MFNAQTRALALEWGFPCPENLAGLVQIGALDKRLSAGRGRDP